MKIKSIVFSVLAMCITSFSFANSVYTAEELMDLAKKGKLPETEEIQGLDSPVSALGRNAHSVKSCKEEVMATVNDVKQMFPTKITFDKDFKFQAQMWMAEGTVIITCIDRKPLASKIHSGAKYK